MTDKRKDGVELPSRTLMGQLAGAGVTLETERIVGRVLAGDEELTLGHDGFEIVDLRSQNVQEVWISGQNASLERLRMQESDN